MPPHSYSFLSLNFPVKSTYSAILIDHWMGAVWNRVGNVLHIYDSYDPPGLPRHDGHTSRALSPCPDPLDDLGLKWLAY